MSLSDKLLSVSQTKSNKVCKIGSLLLNPELSQSDRDNLSNVLDTSEHDPRRINNSDIGRILREEGYDISNSAVDRHRRGDCACKRSAK
jgi:hypothetical protein